MYHKKNESISQARNIIYNRQLFYVSSSPEIRLPLRNILFLH